MVDNWTGRGGCEGLGWTAPGYWGRDIHLRVLGEQEQAKQSALLRDQIRAGGIRAYLYSSPFEAEGRNRCACYKESSKKSDEKCLTCHGTSWVGGYELFGHETLLMSANDGDITLTGTRVTTDFRSSKIELNPTFLTGTIESGDKTFSRTAVGSEWDYEEVSFIRTASVSSVTVEYSLDSGSTWSDISTLPTVNPVSGAIRFKATLTRDTISVLSPLFENVRARYATIDLGSEVGGVYREGPFILVMRDPPVRVRTKTDWGDVPKQDGLTMWTAGLSMFDPSITVGSSDELIQGPYNFIEILDGVMAGKRYVLTSVQNSDPFAYIIVDQNFRIRYSDDTDPHSLVW